MPLHIRSFMTTIAITPLFMACSSSPISQYCASLATCSMDDCELSAEACEELRQGEQDACEAELKATRDVIATGNGAACTTCVEAMDRYYQCAADIDTCTDFVDAATEDCDGEYQEYMEACTPQVQKACGQKSGEDTGSTISITNGTTTDTGADTGTYDPNADPDGDGLTNQEEEDLGLDNHNPDTDGDGFTDGQEIKGNTDAADAEDYPYAGGWEIGACRDSIQPTGKNVGDIAVDFALVDQFGEQVTLHSFCDWVVLVVSMQTNPYQEMDDIVDDEYHHLWQDYERVGLMVVSLLGPEEGVEPSSESAREWADKQGLTHPVLADPGWGVTRVFTGGPDPIIPSYSLFDRGVKIAQLDRALDAHYVLALLD